MFNAVQSDFFPIAEEGSLSVLTCDWSGSGISRESRQDKYIRTGQQTPPFANGDAQRTAMFVHICAEEAFFYFCLSSLKG